MTVDKPATPIMVPTLEELVGENKPQEEPASLPTISLPSNLLVLLPEVSNLGILVGLTSFIATPTFAIPAPLLSLAPVAILPVVEPTSMVQLPIPEAGHSNHLLLMIIPPLVDLSGLPVMMVAAIGLISSTSLPPPLMLATIMAV